MKVPYEAAKYYTWPEIQELMDKWCEAFPELVKQYPIGKTYEGREIICLEMTSPKGIADEKPGYYIDGNFHAGEVTGSAVALYTVSWLLENYGTNDEATEIMDSRTIYLVPRVCIDGSEMYFNTPYTLRSSTRLFPFSEDQPGLHAEDVNGDGWITQMRIKDPYGEFKIDPEEPRLMIRRKPDDVDGDFYRVYQEGKIVEFDGIEINPTRSRWGIDTNRNMPAFWDIDAKQVGSGDYALSEPETKAVADFLIGRKNIAGAQSYHTSGEVHLRPNCTTLDKDMNPADLAAYKALGTRGAEFSGYGHCSVYEGFIPVERRKFPLRGVYLDWVYNHRGILSWSTELWSAAHAAGGKKNDFSKPRQPVTQEEREADMRLIAKWNDEQELDGFIEWEEFDHPQLGKVEIGGWKMKFMFQNPPAKFLPELCESNMLFTNVQIRAMAEIDVRKVKIDKKADGLFEITCGIVNKGYLPTGGTHLAESIKVVRPIEVSVEGEGISVPNGKVVIKMNQLKGREEKKAQWLILGQAGQEVTIIAKSERAGTVRHKIVLP
ncbi:MAG: carboxypeptidase [Firmicutes bacterium]|nr:carboxypeptidase [Bacillota bacterium]